MAWVALIAALAGTRLFVDGVDVGEVFSVVWLPHEVVVVETVDFADVIFRDCFEGTES